MVVGMQLGKAYLSATQAGLVSSDSGTEKGHFQLNHLVALYLRVGTMHTRVCLQQEDEDVSKHFEHFEHFENHKD